MTFKELREQSGMNMKQFAAHFEIPYRTVQNWEAGVNKCPEYLLKLMKFRQDQETPGEWVERHVNVGSPNTDFFCSTCGFPAWNRKTNHCPGCGKKLI